MLDEIFRQLASHGPIGVVAIIAIYVAYRKDQEYGKIVERMLAMQARQLELYHGAIHEVNKTIQALTNDIDPK